jgi:hypothetical protein
MNGAQERYSIRDTGRRGVTSIQQQVHSGSILIGIITGAIITYAILTATSKSTLTAQSKTTPTNQTRNTIEQTNPTETAKII